MEKDRRTVGLATVGCKLNQYETEGIAERLEERGFRVVPFDGPADLYVVNTCTVTGRSDYRSRQMLRRAARANPDALVVATGCYAERDADALAAMPEVGLVVGNSAKNRLASIVVDRLSAPVEGSPESVVVPRTWSGARFGAYDIARFRGYTRAFVKIQDGCDSRCSYCAVPDARGPSRSRPFDEVIEQAALLAANGYRELVLTGVHIGAYCDADGRGLAELLDALTGIGGVERVRLGSVEPGELTPELAAAVLNNDGVCNHLHVPMESGSDRILRRMSRGYSRSEYVEAVRRVTDFDGSCGLGADVMVGFPGETEEDFAETVSLVESLPFTYLHVFAFSPRNGTAAAEMDGRVPPAESRRRSRILREIGAERSRRFRESLVGTTLDVLIEDRDRTAAGRLSGLASNYVRVEVEGGDTLRNRLVRVAVTGTDADVAVGEIVPGSER